LGTSIPIYNTDFPQIFVPFRVKKTTWLCKKTYISGQIHLRIKSCINLFKNFKNTFLNILTLNLWKFSIFICVYQFFNIQVYIISFILIELYFLNSKVFLMSLNWLHRISLYYILEHFLLPFSFDFYLLFFVPLPLYFSHFYF